MAATLLSWDSLQLDREPDEICSQASLPPQHSQLPPPAPLRPACSSSGPAEDGGSPARAASPRGAAQAGSLPPCPLCPPPRLAAGKSSSCQVSPAAGHGHWQAPPPPQRRAESQRLAESPAWRREPRRRRCTGERRLLAAAGSGAGRGSPAAAFLRIPAGLRGWGAPAGLAQDLPAAPTAACRPRPPPRGKPTGAEAGRGTPRSAALSRPARAQGSRLPPRFLPWARAQAAPGSWCSLRGGGEGATRRHWNGALARPGSWERVTRARLRRRTGARLGGGSAPGAHPAPPLPSPAGDAPGKRLRAAPWRGRAPLGAAPAGPRPAPRREGQRHGQQRGAAPRELSGPLRSAGSLPGLRGGGAPGPASRRVLRGGSRRRLW